MDMKNYIFSALAAIFVVSAYAQTNLVAVQTLTEQWGYADEKGNIVIPCKYIDAHSFTSGGVAMVRDANGWKVIDATGEPIVTEAKGFQPKDYHFFTRGFKGEMLLIVIGKKMGYLDARGQLAVPVEYDELSEFRGNYAIGKIGADFYIVDKTGKKTKINVEADLVKYMINDFAVYRYKKLFGFVNNEGNKAIDAKFTGVGNFYGGSAWAREASGKIGFINAQGEWIVQPEYKEVSDPDETYHVSVAKDFSSRVYMQFMDGKKVEVEGATDAGEINEGFTWARKETMVGLINHEGKWIVPPSYSKVEKVVDGYTVVKSVEGKEGLLDVKGNIIIPVKYEKVENISEGLFRVRQAGKWGYLDASANTVIDFQFDGAEDFNYGFAQVKIGTTWGLIDKQGNLVIPTQYRRVKELVRF